jgi:GDP-L-fucose synthase
MRLNAKIFVAGHTGLVGSALVRALDKRGYRNLILKTKQQLDLTDTLATQDFFSYEKPDFVFMCAARVGGIMANKNFPANFIYENLRISENVIHSAYTSRVSKLLFMGSACVYPRLCPQPMHEQYFMTRPLEPTNEAYAISKIAAIKLCQSYNQQYGTNFISVMPNNIYGPHDNFDLHSSHVVPALLHKFIDAVSNHSPSVTIWGTGQARREFIFVDDIADALIFLMQNYSSSEIINVGTGEDISIANLAHLIADIVGFSGDLIFDSTKPDGMPRRLLDVSRLHELGFFHRTILSEGIKATYDWYLTQAHSHSISTQVTSYAQSS